MTIRFAGVAIGCALLLDVPMSAAAAPTTYAFRGQLTQAGQWGTNAAWAFAAGDTFSGSFVYDAAAVTSRNQYIDQADFKLTFYTSPVLSFQYQINTKNGTFAYAPPVAGSYAAVGAATTSSWWSGVDLRFSNYVVKDRPLIDVPASGYVGQYYAHSSFLSLLDYQTRALTDTDVDVDLEGLFAALPPSFNSFSVRFSDPARWKETPGVERIDGVLSGSITSLQKVQGAVPEPSSWGLMILGFMVTGIALRRRSGASGSVRLA